MYGSAVDQDVNCRAVGRCVYGEVIDRELLDLIPRTGPAIGSFEQRLQRPITPLSQNLGRQFLYSRYNVGLSRDSLTALGFGEMDSVSVQKMDNATPENIRSLLAIGAAAAKQIQPDHFGPFL
jgi:hypothetical protein